MSTGKGEVPQYKLSEAAYIDDHLYNAGDLVYSTGVPGWHMKAANEAAKVMWEKHKPKHVNPIEALGNVVMTPFA